MRIVFIAPDLESRSGWSRYSADLARALAAQGCDVRVVVARRCSTTNIPEHRLLRPAVSYMTSSLLCAVHAWRLGRLLRRLQPDIIHFTAEPYAFMLPFLRRGLWKSCITLHGTYALAPLAAGGHIRERFRRALQCADLIFSVSHFTKREVMARDPDFAASAGLATKIVVLPNAIPLRRESGEKEHGSTEVRGQGHDSFVIMGVGAVKERKGYREAIAALATFRAEHPDVAWRYDIYGTTTEDSRYVTALRRQAETAGVGDRMVLHESVPEETLRRAYAEADLFLLLSLSEGVNVEGFGLVFLEAAAAGVPVIGSRSGGCPEAIAHEQSGYVCDPHDPATVALRIASVLLHRRIARADCRAWAVAHDIETSAAALMEHYRALR